MPFKNSDNITAFLSWLARPISDSFQPREQIHQQHHVSRVLDNDDQTNAGTTIIFSGRDVVTTRECNGTLAQGTVWFVSTKMAVQKWGDGLAAIQNDPETRLIQPRATMTNMAPPPQQTPQKNATKETTPTSPEVTDGEVET